MINIATYTPKLLASIQASLHAKKIDFYHVYTMLSLIEYNTMQSDINQAFPT